MAEEKTKSGSKAAKNLNTYAGISNPKQLRLDKSRTSVRKSGEDYCSKHSKKYEGKY
jgi:hypothetical protein